MSSAFDWLSGSALHLGSGAVGAAIVAIATAAKNHTATNLQNAQNSAALLSRLDVLEKRLDDCERRHAEAERSSRDCEARYSELSARLDAVVGATVPPPPAVPA